jgi:CDP-diacylglycerol--serine O-phosphatidyltransferase
MKKHIPNILTICNLLCGCMAVANAFVSHYKVALFFILAAAVFDFLDGFAARLLKSISAIGKELDSLADVISFGLAPAWIAVALLSYKEFMFSEILIFSGLLIVAFSALRLAKFNTDERQTNSFIGLAVPANAIFWAGLANSYGKQMSDNQIIVFILIAVSCFLLVCNLPMFSLKFKNFNPKDNIWQFILIFIALILLIIIRLDAIMWIIAVYILLSVIKFFIDKK